MLVLSALVQSVCEGARGRPVGSARLLGCLELEPLAEILDRFGQDMGAETQGAFDDAGLAAVDPDPDHHSDAALGQ